MKTRAMKTKEEFQKYLQKKAEEIHAAMPDLHPHVMRQGIIISLYVEGVTFAQLQQLSRICDDTHDINIVHDHEPGYSEYTPSSHSVEIRIFGSK